MNARPPEQAAPTPAPAGPTRTRARAVALWALLGATAISWALVVVFSVVPDTAQSWSWSVIAVSSVIAAAVVLVRRPRHPLAPWLVGAATYNFYDLALDGLDFSIAAGADPGAIAGWALLVQLSAVAPQVCLAWVLGLFPDGIARHRYELVVLRMLWLAVLAVPVLFVLSADVPTPIYKDYGTPVANPFALGGGVISGATGGVLTDILTAAPVIIGAALLLVRYARADGETRRPMRWLFVPIALLPVAAVGLIYAFITGDWSLVGVTYLFVAVGFFSAIVIGILQPHGLSAERAIRRSLLYGILWAVIAAAFVVVGSLVGTAAGALLPLDWAIVLAMLAAVAFQPVRTRLQRLADRRIFGERADPSGLIVRLGDALATTDDLDALLPRMAATLEEGLGVRWARVVVGGATADPLPGIPALSVPIEVEGEWVGEIECGPKKQGELRTEEISLVETLATQAGMAVRNVRLKEELAHQAALLRESRARLVRAQEAERRRIERNIHDGVQQDLTALIGVAGHARQEHARRPEAAAEDLEFLQEGLQRVLADVRALAQGIHPSVLTDRGLLAAVEALAARHPVPVSVRADSGLARLRMREELEGAAYFTIAEALANSLKHAHASHIDVELARVGDRLRIRASDDGVGLALAAGEGTDAGDGDPGRGDGRTGNGDGGHGLANLAERVAAVGGRLDVTGAPGEGTTVAAEFVLEGARS